MFTQLRAIIFVQYQPEYDILYVHMSPLSSTQVFHWSRCIGTLTSHSWILFPRSQEPYTFNSRYNLTWKQVWC